MRFTFTTLTQAAVSLLLINQISASSSDVGTHTVADFNPTLFWQRPDPGFYDVNLGLPDQQATSHGGQQIMAIGDINNDKHLDLVTVNSAQDTFQVHYYNEDTYSFETNGLNPTIVGLPNNSAKIAGIIVSKDVQQSQSLYITLWLDYGKSTQSTIMQVFHAIAPTVGQKYGKFVEDTVHPLNYKRLKDGSQPFFFDINGDLINDVLYMNETSSGAADNEIYVRLGLEKDGSTFSEPTNFNEYLLLGGAKDALGNTCYSPIAGDAISSPNSNSFLDLNGDCMSDIFLQKQRFNSATQTYENYYEIYVQTQNTKQETKFCLQTDPQTTRMHLNEQLDTASASTDNIPLVQFEDIDRDGMMDMVFAYGNNIYVYYNKHDCKPYTPSLTGSVVLCYTQEELKSAQGTIFGNFDDLHPTQRLAGNADIQIQDMNLLDLDTLVPGHSGSTIVKLVDAYGTDANDPRKGRLRAMDMDKDGYSELFVTLELKDDQGNQFTSSYLLKNQACCHDYNCDTILNEQQCHEVCTCTQEQADAGRRYFSNFNTTFGVQAITALAGKQSLMLIPYDVDEDGRCDIIVQQGPYVASNQPQLSTDQINNIHSVALIYNNLYSDSNFVKAQMVNTVAEPDGSGDIGPIGSIVIGATFRYIFTTNDGEHLVRVASLQPQSAYAAFQLPHIYNGIGHTTNFIEYLNIATGLTNKLDQWKVVTPIIPNTHLIVFADGPNRQNQKSSNQGAKNWITEQLVNPNKVIVTKILPAIGAIQIITGIVIIGIHMKEKKEDSKNRPQIDF